MKKSLLLAIGLILCAVSLSSCSLIAERVEPDRSLSPGSAYDMAFD